MRKERKILLFKISNFLFIALLLICLFKLKPLYSQLSFNNNTNWLQQQPFTKQTTISTLPFQGYGLTPSANSGLLPNFTGSIFTIDKQTDTKDSAISSTVSIKDTISPSLSIEDVISVNNSGFVGIGTTTPETRLEIRGDGASWKKGFLCIKNLNEDAGIRLYDSDTSVKYHIFNKNDEGDILRIAPAASYASGGITVSQEGFVGIGTVSPDKELDVQGTIRAEEIIVDSGWADYVFKDDYPRMDLNQVEKHIEHKGHLPGIPTEAEVRENGISLGEFQGKLLEKVEELTLYLIEQNKKINEQNEKLSSMKKELDSLRLMVSSGSDSIME